MGMMSMCPVCGSDWCFHSECVTELYAPILGFVIHIADVGVDGDLENYKNDAKLLIEDFNKTKKALYGR